MDRRQMLGLVARAGLATAAVGAAGCAGKTPATGNPSLGASGARVAAGAGALGAHRPYHGRRCSPRDFDAMWPAHPSAPT